MTGQARTVLMLGTALTTKGGIASVVKVYQSAGLFCRWDIVYLATHCDGSAIRKLMIAFGAIIKFAAMLLRGNRFLLHVHVASRASFWRKSAFIIPALWTGRPVLFHLHGAEFREFYDDECGRFRKKFICYVLDRCARIIVLSETWRSFLCAVTNNSNVEVVPNPAVEFHGRTPRQVINEGVLLFLGRLGRRKGIYVLLDALSEVIQSHPGVTVICGGDGEIEEVRQYAVKLGLGEKVKLAGWVDAAERTRLLESSSIYVLPSFAEGVPMSILEAMSAGLPIIATKVGGIPDVITSGQEGLLVDPGDVKALAEAICTLLGNPGMRSEMADNGRATFRKEFSAEIVMDKLSTIYGELGVIPRPECDGRAEQNSHASDGPDHKTNVPGTGARKA